jgi:hypothetical protein
MKKLLMIMGLLSVGSVWANHRSFRLTNVGLFEMLLPITHRPTESAIWSVSLRKRSRFEADVRRAR